MKLMIDILFINSKRNIDHMQVFYLFWCIFYSTLLYRIFLFIFKQIIFSFQHIICFRIDQFLECNNIMFTN